MKPTNLKLISKAKGEARVRTLIRTHLYWLYGFPYKLGKDVYWCCPGIKSGEKEKLSISPKLISKAQRVIYELKRDYPSALPCIVGDVGVWEENCRIYLERTKELISSSSESEVMPIFDLDSVFYQRLEYQYDKTILASEFGIAAQWMCFVDRRNLYGLLDFASIYLVKYIDEVKLNVLLLGKLSWIYLQTNGKYSAYFELIFNPKGFSFPTSQGNNYATPYAQFRFDSKKAKKKFSYPSRPTSNSSKPIISSVDWLLELSESQQRRVLMILDFVGIQKLFEQNLEWWEAVDYLTSKITNFIRYSNENKMAYFRILQTSLEEYIKNYSQLPRLSRLFRMLKELSGDQQLTELFVNLMESLSNLEVGESKKLKVLTYFIECKDDCGKSLRHFKYYLAEFGHYVAHARVENEMAYWGRFEWSYWGSCEKKVFTYLERKPIIKFFE
ncbi:MAG: hypothetical protein OQJ89_00165, partial [Kangiellaceae bacterium]|nr:hypothetical protein [Kangiellaceae bacterium]